MDWVSPLKRHSPEVPKGSRMVAVRHGPVPLAALPADAGVAKRCGRRGAYVSGAQPDSGGAQVRWSTFGLESRSFG